MKNQLRSAFVCGSVLLCQAEAGAQLLHDLDFTPPEVGSYSVLYGSPTLVPSFGGMSDAMLFHARATNWDAIRLDIGAQASKYMIDFDVVTHHLKNSLYAFGLNLSTPETRDVALHGGLNSIEVYQPYPYTDRAVYPFADDTPYHLSITIDFPSNLWQLSVTGIPVYTNAFNATDIQTMVFCLNGWHASAADDPSVLVAIDNIRVLAIPEPSAGALSLVAFLMLMWLRGLGRPGQR